MKRFAHALLLLALVAGAFWAGARYGQSEPGAKPDGDGRKVLYYVDPMNPSHTSQEPGLAPCGMKMEPVYADQGQDSAGEGSLASKPAGTVRISLEKQQLIGMRVGVVEIRPLNHSLRLLGRVAIDETRVYRINATVDGWITKALPNSSGSLVKRHEVLATFYSPAFLSAEQALLFALNSKDRVQAAEHESMAADPESMAADPESMAADPESMAVDSRVTQFKLNIQQYTDSLKNLGMGEMQIEELIRTRRFMKNIDVTAPADGFITARNVSTGQRFDKGTELYQIADLGQVWILADLFENEAGFVQPGLQGRVSLPRQQGTFTATVGQTLPQFDSASRTLKLRLVADNPDYVLKPDMFVDVELPVVLPPALTVPAEAVLDTGLRQTVFMDRGSGFFEPRLVETGLRLGDQVVIVSGVSAGERVVVSGNFLLDSESRIKLAAEGTQDAKATDPVCGMTVDVEKAAAAGLKSSYQGALYFFCSEGCKEKFEPDPERFLKKRPATEESGA